MSATSRAISDECFIETDTSAAARAGESLMPSPTMITVFPSCFNSSTILDLSSGSTCDLYSVMPNALALDFAPLSLSPVSIMTFSIPNDLSSSMTYFASSLTGSSMQIKPSSFPSIAR